MHNVQADDDVLHAAKCMVTPHCPQQIIASSKAEVRRGLVRHFVDKHGLCSERVQFDALESAVHWYSFTVAVVRQQTHLQLDTERARFENR